MVEDNTGDVALMRQTLKQHGVNLELVVMSDGEKAIQFIDGLDAGTMTCPALVILDLNLPKRPGREVLERIRQSDRCGSIPVAVFSSSDAAKDKEEAARLGANRYIRKPTNLEDFLSVGALLKALLGDSRD
jgi:CheY-like chemotaxis protein